MANTQRRHQYDLHEMVTEIPIPKVLEDHGIQMYPYNRFAIRDERTPSCKYYAGENRFHDFGSGYGTNVIHLKMALAGCSKADAIQMLGRDYGIRTIDGEMDRDSLTLSEYRMIGISGEKASLNWTFDLHQPVEELYKLSESLSVSMNELRQTQPEHYAQIIKVRAATHVAQLKQDYLAYQNGRLDTDGRTATYNKTRAEETYAEYKAAYQVLLKAARGTEVKVANLKPGAFEGDFGGVYRGQINMDIGVTSYYDFKEIAGQSANTIFLKKAEYDRYAEAAESGLLDQSIPVSAWWARGRDVKVTVKEWDEGIFREQLQMLAQQAETQLEAARAAQLQQMEIGGSM